MRACLHALRYPYPYDFCFFFALACQACAYIRDSGDSSKGKKRKAVGKDRRKVGKKLSQRGLGLGGPLEVRSYLFT